MNYEEIVRNIARAEEDPLFFMGHFLFTMDEADDEATEPKPFPVHLDYVQQIVKLWNLAGVQRRHTVIEKSRQMRVTWIYAALHLHYAIFNPYKKILLLSQTESYAKLLLTRIKFLLKNIPADRWPPELLPKYKSTTEDLHFYEQETLMRSLTSTPESARSITASRIFFDEFARTEKNEEIYQAASGSLSGGGLGTFVSTNPTLFGESDCLFWRLRDDRLLTDDGSSPVELEPAKKLETRLEGFDVQLNKRNNFVSMLLKYTADPGRNPSTDKGADWVRKQKALTDEASWATEFDCSRETYGGKSVYGKSFFEARHVIDSYTPDPDFPVFRGWDFGFNHSIAFCQYIRGTLYVFDELPNFASSTVDAIPILEQYTKLKYPNITNYVEVVDPSGRTKKDSDGGSNVRVLQNAGMRISYPPDNLAIARINCTLNMLTRMVPQNEGLPALLITRNCEMLLAGFKYAFQFKDLTGLQEQKMKVLKNEHSHVMDAQNYVNYFITNNPQANRLGMPRRIPQYNAPRSRYNF